CESHPRASTPATANELGLPRSCAPLLRSNKLKNKIALEEHFAVDLTIDQSKLYSLPAVWERLKSNLLDIEQQRLERMEQGGTAFSILSLNSPGIQGIPNTKEAIDVSRRANDIL